MSDDTPIKSIFDTPVKPSTAPKKSQFERQKAEAEAKRQRDKAETAAVYKDFVKSFDQDTSSSPPFNISTGRPTHHHVGSGAGHASGGPSKRHFTGPLMRSSASETLGRPPPSFSKKRPYDTLRESQRDRDKPRGIFAFEGSRPGADSINAFQASDDEEDRVADKKEAEKAAAKPTLHVSSLPPGTSPAVIKSLIPPVLVVDNVKILPPPPPSVHGGNERRIWSAIVTLAHDTAATDMDTVVSSLQNKYLGWGFYLSISRHLSSAAIHSTTPITPGITSLTNQPFGARVMTRDSHFGRGGPHRSGIAPPLSYGAGYGSRSNQGLQVDVKPPSDLRQLKLIHKMIENLLTFGPEFEALLMSRAEVQKEEKWAWIWNPKSTGGVWYRWRLWDILTNPEKRNGRGRGRAPSTVIFENGPSWAEPERNLQFEFTTKLDEFVSDEDYDSSDEDDSDREEEKRLSEATNDTANDGAGHLNPLQKAKLTHLLARLPTSHSKLRRGDVARVTAFAIKHAGGGGDEVVDMIVTNVNKPFAYTSANPERQKDENEARGIIGQDDADESTNVDTGGSAERSKKSNLGEKLDMSSASLVGLYIISDILSSSSTSGVRHAWRYRQLFENSLKQHKTFEKLGRIEKELGWGRLKIEKWRRSIGILLNLWEGWCVFPQASHEAFVKSFDHPPPTEREQAEEKARVAEEKEAGVFGGKGKNKWKAVEDNGDAAQFNPADSTGDGDPMDLDVDGAPIPNDDDLYGEPMSDIDGVPMEDSDLEEAEEALRGQDELGSKQAQELPLKEDPVPGKAPSQPSEPAQSTLKRRRPKAEDMFADSDSEG
ncbi:uncharacterized protein GIQ15_01069 [Arthroderma uncinatum]|uniref:uncharacterized protein n=1 Tax=Arthroderma uncinatum TaxID=74035 RepID=UPI00144AB0C9|nr:uncharacterized protein GIQ15_01069 [Arthroderma uncinatum]KAF3491552.1 hypothetical protein GIQ15_01069 [Arthroderma uncinatum]